MWLIVTQGNPEQKRKAKWLTIFIETWYDTAHLKTLVAGHIANLQEQKVPYERALILTKAFSQSKYTSAIERDTMLEYTTRINTAIANNFLELPKKYSDILNEIIKLVEDVKITEAHKLADELENENDGIKFFIKGFLYKREGNTKKAENYYRLAIEKGYINALNSLANLYCDETRNKEAENYYLQAIEKGHIGALFNLANLYSDVDKRQEAENYYLQAIEKGDVNALNNLAVIYYKEGRIQEAENYYLQAIEKGDVNALYNLTILYYEINKHTKKALQFINKYREQAPGPKAIRVLIIIEVWNAVFNNLEERVLQVVIDSNYENLNWFFNNLLIQEQVQIVSNVFANETHGKTLQDKYSLLYYALLLLTNKHSIDNPELRIPPEVMPTVLEIKEDIEQKQAMYANGKY